MSKCCLKIYLLFVAAMLFSSCEVIFQNSIGEKSKTDKKILGRWYGTEENDKESFIEISRKSDYQIEIKHLKSKDEEIITASTVKIGNYYYLNLSKSNKENFIVRYKIENGELMLWMLDTDKIGELLTQNKLKGFEKNPKTLAKTIIITDGTEKIGEFLRSPESDTAFVLLGKLKKIDETSK